MKVWLLLVIALLLALVLPAVLAPPVVWAASPVGLMTVSGPVSIGGAEFQPKAVSSWPVLTGDEIVTADRSRAVLISPTAGRLEIGHDSRVTASAETVVLHGGEVGAERFVVRTGPYTATPQPDASGRSWFVVSSRDGVPYFAAHQGDLWVSQGEPNPLLVRAGTYAVPATPPEPAPPAAASPEPGAGEPQPGSAAAQQYELRPDQSAALPGTPGASVSAQSGWTVGSLGHASSVALVSGVSAAATAGTVVGVALVEPAGLRHRSPSTPK
jgi:hypothetical protein